MPAYIFIGKSSVQTNIYVFRVGEPHHKDETVKFLDFSNDGYSRTNRRKASNNLVNVDRAKERYQEIVDLVRFGRNKLNIFTEKECYEGYIDPEMGDDWNQTSPIDMKPTERDFKETVSEQLVWEIAQLFEQENHNNENHSLDKLIQKAQWGEFKISDLFHKVKTNKLKYKVSDLSKTRTEKYNLPVLTAGIINQGLNNFALREGATILKNVITVSANGANTGATFFQSREFTVLQDAYAIEYTKEKLTNNQYLYFASAISKVLHGNYEWTKKAGWERIKDNCIILPINKNNDIDLKFMESYISKIKNKKLNKLKEYLE